MGNILLAEDEDVLRMLMGRQLRRAGHAVTEAEDGLVAADVLSHDEYDVVVSDMKMPRLDGMGLLSRAADIAPDTEFIILTGHGSMENAVDAFKAGNVFDYLLKPLEDIHELNAVVERALERRRLRSENARLIAKLKELAERDSLTGLFNHRAIHMRLGSALQAGADGPLAVMLIDMDGFKGINDAYGHPVGDQMLQHLAEAMRAACGEFASIGRSGGDEFMMVLPGTSGHEAALVAERVRQQLAESPFFSPTGTALSIRLCFGIADTAGVGHSAAGLIAAADSALYECKQRGGDFAVLHLREQDADSPARTSFNVLDSLVTAIDRKDRYTRCHSESATTYALLLAEALAVADETSKALRVAGLLHDVGKIGVPDTILRKPGKLTTDEYEVMKGHVTISSLIIHGLPNLNDIVDAVANHHERWDGRGYPQGLVGKQIPLLGRIMAIGDAFSAMTVDRPYHAAIPLDLALDEVEREAGAQFDPQLARLFVETMRSSQTVQQRMAA